MTETRDSLLDPRFLRLLSRMAYQLQGRIRGDRRGERRSARRGVGGDFVDVRPYTIGDDLRHLDWHLYARLDTLLVRLYEAQEEHTVHVLLDTSASMGVGKGLFARQLAAALAYLALVSSDRVGVFTLGEGVRGRLGPLRGKGAAHRVFSFIQEAPFEGGTDLARAMTEFTGTRRTGTVLVLSDFLVPEGRREALAALARSRMRVAVLHVLSPEERRPALGADLTLIDAETGQELLVSVDARVQAAYLAQLEALEAQLRETCRSYGFAFIPVDSGQGLEELILGELRRHGIVSG